MPPTLSVLPDGTALFRNLLDQAIVVGVSELEFMASGEVVGQVGDFKGRLDADPQNEKFVLYQTGIRSLAPDTDQFQFRYEGDHQSRRGEYNIFISYYDSSKIILKIQPKP